MKSITEMILDDDIEFIEAPKRNMLVKLSTPLVEMMTDWCDKNSRSINDFLDFAIQRELDYQNGDIRYLIDFKEKKLVHPTNVASMSDTF
jgi:hypothetical protein